MKFEEKGTLDKDAMSEIQVVVVVDVEEDEDIFKEIGQKWYISR